MTTTMTIGGKRVNEAIDYRITKKLNEVDSMEFEVINDAVNRERFRLESDMYVDVLKEWGVITRRKIVVNKIKLTWEQRAWHLKRRLYDFNNGDKTFANIRVAMVDIIDGTVGVNKISDMPFKFTYTEFGETNGGIRVNLKYNTFFEAIQSVCIAKNLNLRFRGTNIEFGKFTKIINVSDNKHIVDKLESDSDLQKYGNIFHILGKDGDRKRKIDNTGDSPTKYSYDKVISSSKISGTSSVATAQLESIKVEYENIRPIIGFQVKLNEYLKYGFNVGDILRVDLGQEATGENGFYRIVRIDIGKLNVDLHFEFSVDGIFSSRTFDPSDTISYLGKKIKEIEVFR